MSSKSIHVLLDIAVRFITQLQQREDVAAAGDAPQTMVLEVVDSDAGEYAEDIFRNATNSEERFSEMEAL